MMNMRNKESKNRKYGTNRKKLEEDLYVQKASLQKKSRMCYYIELFQHSRRTA